MSSLPIDTSPSHHLHPEKSALTRSKSDSNLQRRPTWAKKVRDEMAALKDRKYPTEANVLKRTLAATRYRYTQRIIQDIPFYPVSAMASIRDFYNNEKMSYRVGSLVNSNIVPTLVKSKSSSRILEIKSMRQHLKLNAISSQIAKLNQLVNESQSDSLIS